MFSYISPEQRVPADHPLRPIRQMTDAALKRNGTECVQLRRSRDKLLIEEPMRPVGPVLEARDDLLMNSLVHRELRWLVIENHKVTGSGGALQQHGPSA
jgi:hypothetical protein